jgi:hypothetical protein
MGLHMGIDLVLGIDDMKKPTYEERLHVLRRCRMSASKNPRNVSPTAAVYAFVQLNELILVSKN